ncbi:MAG: DUF1648 domain-containing protein [Kaistella sp.]|nr:DUF1648 domain-containing protein [Kaistella sp.]
MMMFAKIFQILSILLLLFVWIYPAIYFSEFPSIIPVHFDGQGVVDGFGSKYLIWVEAAVATILFSMCLFIYLKPQIINLPDVMKNNTQAIRNFIQVLCFVIMLVFGLMMYYGVKISLGNGEGFSFPPGLIIGFMYLTVIGLLIYVGKANQKRKTEV